MAWSSLDWTHPRPRHSISPAPPFSLPLSPPHPGRGRMPSNESRMAGVRPATLTLTFTGLTSTLCVGFDSSQIAGGTGGNCQQCQRGRIASHRLASPRLASSDSDWLWVCTRSLGVPGRPIAPRSARTCPKTFFRMSQDDDREPNALTRCVGRTWRMAHGA